MRSEPLPMQTLRPWPHQTENEAATSAGIFMEEKQQQFHYKVKFDGHFETVGIFIANGSIVL